LISLPNKQAQRSAHVNDIKILLTQGISPTSDAFVLRREVFVDEQGFTDDFDKADARAIHATLYLDGIAVACGRIFEQKPGHFHLGRIAVRKSYRKQGLGSRIVAALEEAASEKGAHSFVLEAQSHAAAFYETLGYERIGNEYPVQGSPHILMVKQV
jgi:predicted GNAT family N-acyltransferase